MRIISIASSSKGNCYVVDDGKTQLMLECGVHLAKIREQTNPALLDGVLITHEHNDHSKSWENMSMFAPIYLTKGTYEALKKQSKKTILEYNIKLIDTTIPFKIGTFIIRAFKTQHDAAEPVGYYLYSTFLKERLLFATDTYYIENRFDNLNYIMLECNYKREYLDQNTNLPKSARIRLLKSHFELSNVVNFLKANDLSKVKEIYLMHLSAGNSNANEFKQTIQEATGLPTYICNE